MTRRKDRRSKRRQLEVQIGIDRRVLSYIVDVLAQNPHVEEGGKYVGYLLSPSDSRLRGFGFGPNVPAMVVTDFLPSGPNATRTAVELQPDGKYQESLFRQLEQIDPEVEHLGTWHSHHCNGLQTLSFGDVAGYLRTVNKTEYRPNHFLASLVTRLPTDASERDWIDHYLFVRNDKEYYKINELVRIIDSPSTFGFVTGHSSHARKVRQDGQGDVACTSSSTSGLWYELPEGRKILAEDKSFFTKRFNGDMAATRRGGRIKLTGRVGGVALSITYPENAGASQVTVSLRSDDTVIFDIITELQWRRLAMSAALAAVAELP